MQGENRKKTKKRHTTGAAYPGGREREEGGQRSSKKARPFGAKGEEKEATHISAGKGTAGTRPKKITNNRLAPTGGTL